MDPITVAFSALGLTVLFNLAGWGYTIYRNGRGAGKAQGQYEQRVKSLETTVESLPCQDQEYVAERGKLIQRVDEIAKDVKSIEGRINRISTGEFATGPD